MVPGAREIDYRGLDEAIEQWFPKAHIDAQIDRAERLSEFLVEAGAIGELRWLVDGLPGRRPGIWTLAIDGLFEENLGGGGVMLRTGKAVTVTVPVLSLTGVRLANDCTIKFVDQFGWHVDEFQLT